MKKILLLLAFCASALIGSAQDFGKTLVTGSIGYSSSKSETDNNGSNAGVNPKEQNFTFTPQIGFFVAPRWAVGATISYTSSKVDDYSYTVDANNNIIHGNTKTQTYAVGPFVRYYQPVGEKAAFFGQASVGYQHTKQSYDYSSPNYSSGDVTYNGAVTNLMPGFVFFPSNKIGLELTLGNISYQRTKQEQEDSDYSYKYNSFNIGFGLENVNIGISLYLGRTASE